MKFIEGLIIAVAGLLLATGMALVGAMIAGLIIWLLWDYTYMPQLTGLEDISWWTTTVTAFVVSMLFKSSSSSNNKE